MSWTKHYIFTTKSCPVTKQLPQIQQWRVYLQIWIDKNRIILISQSKTTDSICRGLKLKWSLIWMIWSGVQWMLSLDREDSCSLGEDREDM